MTLPKATQESLMACYWARLKQHQTDRDEPETAVYRDYRKKLDEIQDKYYQQFGGAELQNFIVKMIFGRDYEKYNY